jgi:hypothetical protein
MSPQKETNQTRDNQNAAAHSESGNVTAPALAVLSPPPLQLSAVPTEKKEEPDSIEQEVFAGKSFSSGPSMPAEQPSTPPSLGNNSENKDKSITPFQLKKTGGIIQKKETLPFQKKSNQSSSSSSLPEDTRGKMENAFKTDFSNVNIHTNSQSATDVGALAYTQGNDVHFAPGQFKPNTQSGQELIGHELTHVVQQRAGKVQPTTNVGGMPVNDSKGLENEADNMGRKAAQFRLNPSSPVEKNTSNPIASSTIQRQEDTAAQTQNTSLAATPVQSTHQSPAPVSGNATALVENAPQAQEGNATTAPKGGQKSEESKGSKAPAPAQTQENIAPASKKAGKAAKSTSSKTDAAFEGEKEKITLKATEQKEHEPTEKKVIDTQKAAKAPANEVQSLAQEKQVGKMNEQQPGEFNAAAFEEKLLARVEAFAPNNLDETTKFKSSGKTKNLKNTVSTDVQTAKKETKEDIEVTTKEAPDTSSVTAKEVVAMPSPEKAPEKGSIDSVKAAPKAKPTAVVSQPLQENS